MLRFVPLDTPIGKGDILAGDRPVLFILAATAATIAGVFLVYLGIEMALDVSGFASFHLHNDKVNRCQPPGLILISSVDGLFYFGSTFSALGKTCNKILHFFHSGGRGSGGTN